MLTARLRSPTRSPLRISRASSLWPTSSKASVASWPPTSSMTSSPPLDTCLSLDLLQKERGGMLRAGRDLRGIGRCGERDFDIELFGEARLGHLS